MQKFCVVALLLLSAVSCRSSSNNAKHPDDPGFVGNNPGGSDGNDGCLKAHATWSEAINTDDNNTSLANVFVNPEGTEAQGTMKKVRSGTLSCDQ